MKKIIALIMGIILAISLISCSGDGDVEIVGGETSPYDADDIAIKSKNFSFTRGEVSYVFYQNYNDFRYENQDSIDMYNIDTSASLKDQIYYDDVTWFDYIAELSTEYMQTILTLLEAAKEAGMELTEEEMKTVDENVKSYKEYAKNYDYTEAEFFSYLFNSDVTSEVLSSYMEKEALAFKYYNSIVDGYDFSEEDLKAHVAEYPQYFYCTDYIKFTFDEDDSDNAKTIAEEAAKITDAASFEAYIVKYLTETKNLSEDEIDTDEYYSYFTLYDEYSDFSKWAHEEDPKDGDTYLDADEVDGKYTVYFLIKAPYLQDYVTKDIRYIVTKVETHLTADKAKEHAEDLLKQWQDGEATEHSFGELAYNESEDTNTNLVGGLVEGVSKAHEGLSDDMLTWLFEEERTAGDTGIFKYTGYYYTVYFVGDGDLKWKEDANLSLSQKTYSEYEESLIEKYPVDFFDEVIDSLKA